VNLKGKSLVSSKQNEYVVRASAGEVWHEFVMYCLEHNYNGLENLSLIPGSVGASPMQNIGAYGVEIKDTFRQLTALNIDTLEIETFDHAACEFGYRESVFKRRLKNKYVILSVEFNLYSNAPVNTTYGAISKELEAMGISDPKARDVSNAVINIRRSKLPDPAVIGNAGSFFKNPEIPADKHQQLQTDFPGIVSYALDNGNFKLAAGWLIESCGWKGKSYGDAGVHKLQALVLVNYGNAKGSEIFDLSGKIIESVKEKFGVVLEREVNVI
jgi:UDP-N-acetylmuramate dehydrogenase